MDTGIGKSMFRKDGNLRHRIIVLVLAFLFISAITATFLGVYLTRNVDDAQDIHSHSQDESCDDVAIIGAGVGGSYTAWRLRDRNLSVSVYEYSGRIGGRMHSVRFRGIPDINIELGAMRFIPFVHPLMNATAHALGLSITDFRPGLGLDVDSLMYIRGKHFKRSEAITSGAYSLPSDEIVKDDFYLRWSAFVNGTDFASGNGDRRNETFVLYLKTKDGLELNKQSVTLAYTTIGLSGEAIKLLRDTFGFHSYYGDISASETIPVRSSDPPAQTVSVKTIREGMEQIPQKLMEGFLNASTRNQFLKNHRLRKILKRKDSAFQLEFQKSVSSDAITKDLQVVTSVCAKKVVLAVPKMALKMIDWEVLRQADVADILENASRDSPAAKVFLAYDRPWWRSLRLNSKHSLSDRPNRQTYDFGTSSFSDRSVLLAVYTDMDDVHFWREIQFLSKPYNNCSLTGSTCASRKVVEYANKFLGEIYNISTTDIPNPIDTAISLWDNYPYGAAWHLWRPGYIWNHVKDRMIQPEPTDNVFISTGMFSLGSADGWAESALNAADVVLDRI